MPKRAATNPTNSIENDASPEQDALLADLKRLEDDLQRMAGERESLHEQLLRTMADMQNYKRRVEQERQSLRLRATEDLLRDLLPVLDTFERTLAAAAGGASVESLAEGVKGVDKLLRTALEARQLKRVQSVGEKFDPVLHDALGVVEETDAEPGTIVEEIESGYTLGEQVLRPARVRVAKGLP